MRILLFPAVVCSMLIISCGNQEAGHTKSRTLTDSLQDDVLDLHNIGMAKMKKLTQLEHQTQHLVDSIGKLPAKARQASAHYMQQLDSLAKELHYAEFAMTKWMEEFVIDSANNDTETRIKYLSSEKDKVTKVKEVILASLQKADTLLKK